MDSPDHCYQLDQVIKQYIPGPDFDTRSIKCKPQMTKFFREELF